MMKDMVESAEIKEEETQENVIDVGATTTPGPASVTPALSLSPPAKTPNLLGLPGDDATVRLALFVLSKQLLAFKLTYFCPRSCLIRGLILHSP